MVEIIFESHGTTTDNEAHRASGWFDAELSDLGAAQGKELGERYQNEKFDAVFCADQKRASDTAGLAFEGREFPIVIDSRLRECNYGDLNHHLSSEVDIEKPKRIDVPFPGGESYNQTNERMKSFLGDLLKDYDGKRVMIIGSRATQYGLECWILGKSIDSVISAPWKWQPGWTYTLKEI